MHIKKLGLSLLIPASLSFGSGDEATTFSTVTVNASRLEESLSSDLAMYGNQMEVISREQIDDSGVDDLNGILRRYVPGLYVSGKNGRYDYGTYSLQGSRSSDILWMVDGVRVNNRLFGGVYMDSISPVMIERIEVLKGGQGVIYGTEAVAGVINIITRSYEGRQQGQFTMGGDTLGTHSFGGFVTDKIGDTEVLFFGSSDVTDGFKPWKSEDMHRTTTDRKRGYDVQNLGMKLARDFGTDTRVSLFWQHNKADLDFARPYFNVQTQNKRTQDLVTLKLDHQVNDQFSTMIKAYHHNWDTDYFRLYQDEDGNLTLHDNDAFWGFTDQGLNMMGKYDSLNGDQLLFGYEQQRYEGEDEVQDFESELEVAHGIYGQYRPYLSILPDTKVAIGVRYNKIESGEDATVFGASADHPLTDNLSMQVSGGTSFRLPTAQHLFAKSGPEDIQGNRDLDPEKGKNANLGLTWSEMTGNGTVFNINTTVFWREVEDLIGTQTIDGRRQYQNLDNKVKTTGFEVGGQMNLMNGWIFNLAATRADTKQHRADADKEKLAGIPDWYATAGVNFDSPNRRWGSWSTMTYTGTVKKHDTQYGKDAVLDLGAWYRFGPKRDHRVSARIENLLDNEYYTDVFNPGGDAPDGFTSPVKNLGAPRNLQVTYSYSF